MVQFVAVQLEEKHLVERALFVRVLQAAEVVVVMSLVLVQEGLFDQLLEVHWQEVLVFQNFVEVRVAVV